jgi:2-polyprenyl-3-methyl-5-hydroxy-6-metoxy-1,4-benzoquinol methylase
MLPHERENERYASGADNPIEIEEELMLSLLPGGETLLDIGCGMGTIGLLLKQRGFDYVGVDFSDVAIRKAREKGLEAVVADVDAVGLEYPDGHFDVVWAGDVLEHVFDPIGLLRHTVRVLKPGGVLLLTVPNDFTLISRLMIFLTGRSVQSGVYRSYGQCKHHTAFSWELLQFMLGEARLKVTDYKSLLQFPRSKREIRSGNRTLGRWFGKVFIIKAEKL